MPRHAMTMEELATARTRMLKETGRLIANGGYAALSMRRLADSVGLTAGALYRYFPTKQHLILAFLSDALAQMNAEICAVAARDISPVDRLQEMLLVYGRFGLTDRDRFRALFLENDLGEAEAIGQNPETFAGYQAIMVQVSKGQTLGLLRPFPPPHATNLLWAAVHGAVTLVVSVKEVEFGDPDQFIRDALAISIRGMRTDGTAEARHAA